VRSLQTRPNIKPRQRARIIERDGGRCFICGERDRLDAGHLISIYEGRKQGFTEAELMDDENLMAMCARCNSGFGRRSLSPRWVAAALRAHLLRQEGRPA
jgi:5-methylcytosine-specific restriction endonuclease McrA